MAEMLQKCNKFINSDFTTQNVTDLNISAVQGVPWSSAIGHKQIHVKMQARTHARMHARTRTHALML